MSASFSNPVAGGSDNSSSAGRKNNSNPATNAIKPASVSLPSGGGAIKGIGETFKPDTFTGGASYSIPIPVTPARNFEPQLSIDYESTSGNGIFGMGFSMSLPQISICTEKGIPKYDGNDIFLFNGNELVRKAGSTQPNGAGWTSTDYLPRVQSAFALIRQFVKNDGSESYWMVTSSDNTVSIFGKSDASRIYNPDEKSKIFQWLIELSTDERGNSAAYSYKAENDHKVPDKPWEQNRSYNNKYIQSIQYGNYGPASSELFAFQLIFDYGEYVLPVSGKTGSNPYQPVNEWAYRNDAFSSYSSGFEIRTCRLCQNILLFHLFPEKLGDPCLVKALQLDYQSAYVYNDTNNPGLSLMKHSRLTGYRRSGDKATDSYLIEQLPPMVFSFSTFDPPDDPLFKILEINREDIPGYINNSAFQPLDFNSEGIAGLLYNSHESVYYCAPQGNGKYEAPAFPNPLPTDRDLGSGSFSLTDLDGNGQLDLVVTDPKRNGYYLRKMDGNWQSFVPFKSTPTNVDGDSVEITDLNNTGRTDAVIVNSTHITVYPSLGTEGYGLPLTAKKEADFPSAKGDYLLQYVGFSDMMGDGLSHRVKIANGSVECWPDMGYGVFGKKVIIGNAPWLGSDFSVTRLFLADIDGSGTTDLAYVYQDRINIYINQCGNYFADPVTVYLPEPYSSNDEINFADILGNGTNCLVYTKAGPAMRSYYYDFVGGARIDGKKQDSMKPYLLVALDNNLGTETRIHYCSSTKTYLEDKKAGNPWCTKLPFPVQVIERLIVIDKLNKCRYSSRFKFHDGYYDPVERQFAGFGYVETWDSEKYQEITGHSTDGSFKESNHVPPVYNRAWYRTGAEFDNPSIMTNYKEHFFKGDLAALDFPDFVFDDSIYLQDSDTLRQAYAALQGQQIRTEVYADDKDQNPQLYQNPYTVSESNSKVLLYQDKGDQRYAVFMTIPRESISYNYERNPVDPRMQQSFTLSTDAFGNTLQSCTVYLARRPNSSVDFVKYPEQYTLRASLVCNSYVTPLQGFLYFDVSCESQQFELSGIEADTGSYFSFNGLKKQIDSIGLPDRSKIIPYGGSFGTGVQARQMTWSRQFFWDWSNQQQYPSQCVVSSPALLHHIEEAVFTKEFTIDIFDGRLIDEASYDNGSYLSNPLYTHGGYFYDPSNGYWWNNGLIQYYLATPGLPNSPQCFYQPFKTENSFAKVPPSYRYDNLILPSQDATLIERTTISYDDYYLFPVDLIEQVNDTVTNTQSAYTDYISGQTKQLIDINGNTHQVLFDPLGQVIVTSLFGTEAGAKAGDMTLYDDGVTKAQYQDAGPGTFIDITGNPGKYLQGAQTYFFYNLDAWKDEKQPACCITLTRNDYWTAASDGPYCQILISYFDGMGRDIEKKLYAGLNEVGISGVIYQKWLTSGRTVYNNKEMPCEQYLPFFSATPEYEDQQYVPGPPPTVTHYDPLSRVIRTDTPKRFFSKVEFTPWEQLNYDENDTILDSWFFINDYPHITDPNEKDGIDKAIKCYNTPSITILDNKGDPFLSIGNNLGNVPKDAFTSLANPPAITSEEIWDNLVANGYLAPHPDHPTYTLHFLTAKFQPYTKGFTLNLDPKYNSILQGILNILKENCLTSYSETDISGKVKESIDPRLYYGNVVNNTTNHNFQYNYPMTGDDPVLVNSVDAGNEKHLSNIFGSQLWTLSARNYCQFILYDRLQRKTGLSVKKITTPGMITGYDDFNMVEVMTYGETVPQPGPGTNLRGQIYEVNDLSGIVINSSFSMLEKPLNSSRQMLADYHTAVNWRQMVPLLETTVYSTAFTYNALGQIITQTTPDGTVTTNSYNQAGQLRAILAKYADNKVQSIIDDIEYDENSLRKILKSGNKVVTKYQYEQTTLLLLRLQSTRPPNGSDPTLIQDTDYFYDAVGNTTRTLDNTAEIIFCNNQRIAPLNDYTYDPLYRLTRTTGRQHIGINANTYQNNSSDSFKQCIFGPPPFISDSDKLENYKEYYTYDDSGNLVNIQHTASTSWSRPLPVQANSNRLLNGSYDDSGNLRKLDLPGNVELSFNCCENLVKAGIIQRLNEPDDCDYYLYDCSDGRTRKVSEKLAQGGTVTQVVDKIYIGNFEVTRTLSVGTGGATTLISERQTLRVMDDQSCVAIINYTVTDTSHPEQQGVRQHRFQMDNKTGSVCLELNETAQLISYEEYFPYGGTSIITGSSQTEVKLKEYRYSGKECDDSTGLYYYGARYYLSWMGRWLNADPAGTVDGMNLFAFVGGNPITFSDPVGTQKQKQGTKRTRGEDPEFDGLPDREAKKGNTDMIGMRAKPNVDGTATKGYVAINKSFKSELRVHWKGNKDKWGRTTGIVPDITVRDSKAWTPEHGAATHEMSKQLKKKKGFTPLDNGGSSWGAENSHLIAGSFWGPNDVISAAPASVHQNTEWLAIESGIKSLVKNSGLGNSLRIKATGYIHEMGSAKQGQLKSARYKIYIGGKKVFDHVSLGDRGNIDSLEATGLKNKVVNLNTASPAAQAYPGAKNKGLSGAAPPSLAQVKAGRKDSTQTPMFTGITLIKPPTFMTGVTAFNYMTNIYH